MCDVVYVNHFYTKMYTGIGFQSHCFGYFNIELYIFCYFVYLLLYLMYPFPLNPTMSHKSTYRVYLPSTFTFPFTVKRR